MLTGFHKQIRQCLFSYLFILAKPLRRLQILVLLPGIEPGSLAVKVQSPNYWTSRKFPKQCLKSENKFTLIKRYRYALIYLKSVYNFTWNWGCTIKELIAMIF